MQQDSYYEYLLSKIDVSIESKIKTRSTNREKRKPSNILNISNANNLGSNTHS